MSENKNRHLKLVIDSANAPDEKSDLGSEEVTELAIAAGKNLLGDELSGPGAERDSVLDDNVVQIVPRNSKRIAPRGESPEQRASDLAANLIHINLERLTQLYNPQKSRDITAGKLYTALLFVSQAGTTREDLDYFLAGYTSPHEDNIELQQARLARLVSSLPFLQEAFDFILDSEEPSDTETAIKQFQALAGKSRVWSDAEQRDILRGCISNAYVIVENLSSKEGIEPDNWLDKCRLILAQDGLGFKLSKENEIPGSLDGKLEDLTEQAWKDWLPPIRHPIDIS